MMNKNTLSTAALAMALFSASPAAFAQSAAVAPASEAVAEATSVVTPTLSAAQLPKVTVRWACGDCTQNDKVAPLISSDYEAEAARKGYTVSGAETAEIVITEYRQRPPAMRVMFGVFAGKDKLSTTVIFRGKEYRADDYSANAFSGMNGLCASVAKTAANQISRALGS
jgi:hypothetical protein